MDSATGDCSVYNELPLGSGSFVLYPLLLDFRFCPLTLPWNSFKISNQVALVIAYTIQDNILLFKLYCSRWTLCSCLHLNYLLLLAAFRQHH